MSLACVLVTSGSAAAHSGQDDPIHAGYLRVYAGDFEGASGHFGELHSRNPDSLPPWFGLLVSQIARIELEESLAPTFEQGVQAFIDHVDARYSRSSADAEALFFLAQSLMLRSAYRFNFDKGLWGAARDAARAKGLADEYVKQYPGHGDAYLTLGLYNYYVDIAPVFIKVIRVLLLLPAGNKAEGLRQLERAAREGNFFAPLAEGALADIYGSLEGRLAEAIAIGERYVRRFPGNAVIRLGLADLYGHPTVEAYSRAAEQYAAVINAATSMSARDTYDRQRAAIGLANLRRSQWRIEEAIALLAPTIDQKPQTPAWVLPIALLRRANYRMVLNDPAAGDDARRVLAAPTMREWHKPARQQLAIIDRRRKTNEGAIYAALIPGNRLVVEDRWDAAKAAYERLGASHPGDWQVRYRLAYLEFARGNYDAAAAALQPVVATTASVPDWLRAAAMLNLAWTHDLAGRRDEALKLYKRIVDDYEDEGPLGAARVGLIAPYRGPIKISLGIWQLRDWATAAGDWVIV